MPRSSAPIVSVVLPCYRAAPLARRSVEALQRNLDRLGISHEIIVVNDGGTDFFPGEWDGDACVTLIQIPRNRGKGAAVRTGMLAACGQVRIFTDVDLPFGWDLIPVIASYLLERSFHVVIGDRSLPDSSYIMLMPWPRRIASGLFTSFVGTLVTGGFFDTQCGLKGIRGDVADALFPRLKVDRFAFDVELIYVALKHRLDIKRIPVRLERNDTSSIRLVRDSLRGFIDIFRIKLLQLRGAYAAPELDNIVQHDFADLKTTAIGGRSEPRDAR